ncbi:hypothetical protein ACFX1X_024613 [Malus domestica]
MGCGRVMSRRRPKVWKSWWQKVVGSPKRSHLPIEMPVDVGVDGRGGFHSWHWARGLAEWMSAMQNAAASAL